MSKRLDRLVAATKGEPGQDYSRGGEVERSVRQFLNHNKTEWFYRTRIALHLGLNQQKLDRVLWWMLRKGDVQMMKDSQGHLRWRAR